MVIQVSGGETADGPPRPLDRYAAGRSRLARPTWLGPGTAALDAIPPAPADGPAAGMPVDPRPPAVARKRPGAQHSVDAGPPVDPRPPAHLPGPPPAAGIAYGYDPKPPSPAGNPPTTPASRPGTDRRTIHRSGRLRARQLAAPRR